MCRTEDICKPFLGSNRDYGLRCEVSQSYMFGLDLDAADQLCVLPVIKCQAIHRPHPEQETSVDP